MGKHMGPHPPAMAMYPAPCYIHPQTQAPVTNFYQPGLPMGITSDAYQPPAPMMQPPPPMPAYPQEQPGAWSNLQQWPQATSAPPESSFPEIGIVRREERIEYECAAGQTCQLRADNCTTISADSSVMNRTPTQEQGDGRVPCMSRHSANVQVTAPPKAVPENGKRLQLTPNVALKIARDVEENNGTASQGDKRKEVEIKITEQVIIAMKDDDERETAEEKSVESCTQLRVPTDSSESSDSSVSSEDSNELPEKQKQSLPLVKSKRRQDPRLQRLIKLERLLREKMAKNPELRKMLPEEVFLTKDEAARMQERQDREVAVVAVQQRDEAAQTMDAAQADINRLLQLEAELKAELAKLQCALREPLSSRQMVEDGREKLKSIGEATFFDRTVFETPKKERVAMRDFAVDVHYDIMESPGPPPPSPEPGWQSTVCRANMLNICETKGTQAALIVESSTVSDEVTLASLSIRDHPNHQGKFIVALEPPQLLINASAAAHNWSVLWHTRAVGSVLSAFGLEESGAASEVTAMERRLAVLAEPPLTEMSGLVDSMAVLFRLRHFVAQALNRLVHVSDSTELWIRQPPFVQGLLRLLDESSPQTPLNYLGFRLLVRVAPFLPAVPGGVGPLLALHLAHGRPLELDTTHACLRLTTQAQPHLALLAVYKGGRELYDRLQRLDFAGRLRAAVETRLQRSTGLLDAATRAQALRRLRRLQVRAFFPDWVRAPPTEQPLSSHGLAAFVEASSRMTTLRQGVRPEARWMGSPLDGHCSLGSRSLYVPASLAQPSLARLSARASACLMRVLLLDTPPSLFQRCFPSAEVFVDAAALPVAWELFRATHRNTSRNTAAADTFFTHFSADLCQWRSRVILPLSSSAEFRNAFNCSGDDAMAKLGACGVWGS
ncbi:hypothetical protein MTO96_021325 [Rhipicephalus appendiculatus]